MNGYLIVMIIMALAILAVVIAAFSDDDATDSNELDDDTDFLTDPEER